MKFKVAFYFFVIALVMQSCCIWEGGAWDPLPCGKADKVNSSEEKDKEQIEGKIDKKEKNKKKS